MALPCLAALLAGSSSQAAVLLADLDLGGSQQTTTTWEDLSSANSTLTPDSGTGTVSVSPTAFQGSFGFYSFTADYTVTAAQSTGFDIASVVWQIECSPNPDLAWPSAGGPYLTVVTGSGTEVFQPVAFGTGDTEYRYNFGPSTPILYTAFAWQWDLSGIEESIMSISLTAPIPIHTSLSATRIDAANSFSHGVVPEPSVLLLSFAALPLVMRRRRTA